MPVHRSTNLIPTKLSESSIAAVKDTLKATAKFLSECIQSKSPQELDAPLTPGEWSFREVMAHLLTTNEVSMNTIVYGMALNEPILPEIHPRRDWGRLLQYADYPLEDILHVYQFKRRVLLGILGRLSQKQWSAVIHRPPGKATTVFLQARGIALHDLEHVEHLKVVWKG